MLLNDLVFEYSRPMKKDQDKENTESFSDSGIDLK